MITEYTGGSPLDGFSTSRLLLMAPNPAVLEGVPPLWSPVTSETTNGNTNTNQIDAGCRCCR